MTLMIVRVGFTIQLRVRSSSRERSSAALRSDRASRRHDTGQLYVNVQDSFSCAGNPISDLLLHQLNLELSAGDKSSHTVSLNLEILPVFLRFRSLAGTISHPASQFTIKLVEQ
jgi:hypothetical protein